VQDKYQQTSARLPVQNPLHRSLGHFTTNTSIQTNSTSYPNPTNSSVSASTTQPKVQNLLVEKIYFSQRSVSPYFTDGCALSTLVQDLVEQKISPDKIPSIRVVFYNQRWVTLDNRRLRVFKDAGITAISVEVCDLSVPEVKREFDLKRTHKAIENGGEIRQSSSSTITQKDEHFDQGTFIFTKKILSWNLTQIQTLPLHLQMREVLPDVLDRYAEYSAYYEQFLDLILEEARAVLHQALEEIEKNKPNPVGIKLMRHKLAKNVANPSSLYFEFQKSSDANNHLLRSGDIALLSVGTLRFIAMAGYVSPEEGEKQIWLKAVIDQDMRVTHSAVFETGYKTHQAWQLYRMESLVTHLRMYEACVTKKDFSFIEQVMFGNLSLPTKNATLMSNTSLDTALTALTLSVPVEQPELKKLNTSQAKAVKEFLCLEYGMRLIQGPPGTGKTTTLITLLEMASKNTCRILVCAPSNKAVQILAERFLQNCPATSAILVGVEDKLPDKPVLKNIFIHTWKAQIQSEIEGLFELAHRLKEPLILPEKKLPDASEENEANIHKNPPQELPILSQKQRKALEKTAQKLTEKFTHFVNRLKLFELAFFAKWMIEQADFLPALQNYVDHLYLGNKNAMRLSLEWIQAQQKSLGILYAIISHVNLILQSQEDEAIESALLNTVKVIFATLSVTGRKAFRELQAVDSLIIDEAGQAVEAETLIALQTNPKKCLLVGDTKQLPATVISKFAAKLKFDRSLLWRLLEDCKQPHGFLQEQYRMHPEISEFPSKRYYNTQLVNAPKVADSAYTLATLKAAPPFLGPYAFIDVDGQEAFGNGRSLWNFAEQCAVVSLVKHLDKRYHIEIEKQVGIITFYKAQVEKLSEKLHRFYPKLTIQTVDGFQGGENDIIIISFVRANSKGNIGFLSDFRRLNVAITRARYALLMVGHSETLANNEKDVSALLVDAKAREKIFSYKEIAPQLQLKSEGKPRKKQHPTSKHEKHSTPRKNAAEKPPRYEQNRCYFFNGASDSCKRGSQCTFSHAIQPSSNAIVNKNQ
jgi:hypothetical protein